MHPYTKGMICIFLFLLQNLKFALFLFIKDISDIPANYAANSKERQSRDNYLNSPRHLVCFLATPVNIVLPRRQFHHLGAQHDERAGNARAAHARHDDAIDGSAPSPHHITAKCRGSAPRTARSETPWSSVARRPPFFTASANR